MIGSEAQPFAKTGGLADVLGHAVSRARPSRLGRGRRAPEIPRGLGGHVRRDVRGQRRRLHARRGLLRGAASRRRPRAAGRLSRPLRSRRVVRPLNIDHHDNVRCFAFLVRAALEFTARRCVSLRALRALRVQTADGTICHAGAGVGQVAPRRPFRGPLPPLFGRASAQALSATRSKP